MPKKKKEKDEIIVAPERPARKSLSNMKLNSLSVKEAYADKMKRGKFSKDEVLKHVKEMEKDLMKGKQVEMAELQLLKNKSKKMRA
jgi:hypothetical protein